MKGGIALYHWHKTRQLQSLHRTVSRSSDYSKRLIVSDGAADLHPRPPFPRPHSRRTLDAANA